MTLASDYALFIQRLIYVEHLDYMMKQNMTIHSSIESLRYHIDIFQEVNDLCVSTDNNYVYIPT